MCHDMGIGLGNSCRAFTYLVLTDMLRNLRDGNGCHRLKRRPYAKNGSLQYL